MSKSAFAVCYGENCFANTVLQKNDLYIIIGRLENDIIFVTGETENEQRKNETLRYDSNWCDAQRIFRRDV